MVNVFLIVICVIFAINAKIDYSTRRYQAFTLDAVMLIWGACVYVMHTSPFMFAFIVELIYLAAVYVNIRNKKHLPIIVTSLIVLFANYILTHF